MTRLTEKIALVTGAGRGMGRVIALRLAQEGATLVIHYGTSRSGADEGVEIIRGQGGKAFAVQANLSRRAEVQRMFEEIDREVGHVDIVVNSAGVSASTPLQSFKDEAVEEMLGVNLLGPLYVASEASKRMGVGGRIVNVSSSLAEFPLAGSSVYTGTKAAIKAFTEVWAKELGPKGITVNTVTPGATSPGMMDSASAVHREFFAKASPFSRIGRAEEIASVVAFLCSPEASWVSGAHILANGAANA
jgi:3-oxoacyl-[acyl-carrier protein] reductase